MYGQKLRQRADHNSTEDGDADSALGESSIDNLKMVWYCLGENLHFLKKLPFYSSNRSCLPTKIFSAMFVVLNGKHGPFGKSLDV